MIYRLFYLILFMYFLISLLSPVCMNIHLENKSPQMCLSSSVLHQAFISPQETFSSGKLGGKDKQVCCQLSTLAQW